MTGHDTYRTRYADSVSVVGREAAFNKQAARGAGVWAQNENVPVFKIEGKKEGKLENY